MTLRTKLIQKLIHINEAVFFYPALKKFYKKALPNKELKILDVGANKGQSIDFFLNLNKQSKIDSFEPNKKLFSFLLKKYKSNPNIKLYNLGLSHKNGEQLFHENILDETSTFENLNYESEYLIKKARILNVSKENIIIRSYMVKTIRLIDVLTNNPNTFFDVLKIDVEGHELNCLKGLFLIDPAKIPIRYIQIESHNDDMYLNTNQSQEIENLMTINGFKQIFKVKHGFGDFEELIFKNSNLNEA
jgi:FkbM family methyltransferase